MNSLIPPDDLPDYDFNGLTYQPKNKKNPKEVTERLKKELKKILLAAKKAVVTNDRRATLVGVPPTEAVVENIEIALNPYKKAWDEAMKSLPEWRQKEIDFLIKSGDTENRHYTTFVQLVVSMAEHN